MIHVINGIEVDIHWGKAFFVENHGSGCKEYGVTGTDENDQEYSGCGTYQSDELVEVTDIEIEN